MDKSSRQRQGSQTDKNTDIPPVPAEELVEIGNEQHPDTADDHSDRARRDHSEREGGGDQDIDTAGQIPGNKATDSKEPTDV
jgi:hypothetical protein